MNAYVEGFMTLVIDQGTILSSQNLFYTPHPPPGPRLSTTFVREYSIRILKTWLGNPATHI